MTRPDERREFQRLTLNPPVPGALGATVVSILEIGVLGGRVLHSTPFEATKGDLRFSRGQGEIVLRCEVVRTSQTAVGNFPGAGFESGLRFMAAIGESGDRLREMLSDLVLAELELRRDASMKGIGPAVDGDKTVRGKDAAYTCYRFEHNSWSKRRVFLPEQPPVGFTVARSLDNDEMQRLCAVYEASDAEGRRLIRLFAELSVSDALQIPPVA